ncbi:LmeA family phospholipid-binding protein [Microbacterium invictum]|uniref:LmeA family phospholipid-binding protein n=1 Tax=Microbacterium invictum TaxID=515415 RepID=A0ABZ0V8E7_9MICO|nr:LmeA family phospholipid-binding protein [Microbacterium invictum]WQB69394.1 LmeA family phospholipid-binding protein [Microbacterium invictum]
MTTGDTQPTRPLPEWAIATAPPARRRRRVWPWLLAVLVVAGLAVVAWFVGEAVARDLVIRTVREQVITTLALPADQRIDVEVDGAVLPQLIRGSLDDLTISSDDVTIGQLTGDVSVNVQGVPIRGDADLAAGSGSVTLDAAQLQSLLGSLEGFPEGAEVALDAPDVHLSTSFPVFGVEVPVTVAVVPSAVEGDLALTPSAVSVAGAELTADGVRDQFGGLADGVLQTWTVCIAGDVPAGITLTDLVVDGDRLTGSFEVDPAIVRDVALQENGTCA